MKLAKHLLLRTRAHAGRSFHLLCLAALVFVLLCAGGC